VTNTEPPQDNPDIVAASWTALRQFVAWALRIFGEPGAIARRFYEGACADRKLLIGWLRGMEALARHLLTVEASRLPKPAPMEVKGSVAGPKQPSVTARHGRPGFGNDDSEQWRVRFALLPPARPDTERRRRDEDEVVHRYFSLFALAERMEALIRVVNDPAPFAARLSRALWARPARASDTLKLPNFTSKTPGLEEIAALMPLAHEASARFYDSG
jgi:hypothetical protein